MVPAPAPDPGMFNGLILSLYLPPLAQIRAGVFQAGGILADLREDGMRFIDKGAGWEIQFEASDTVAERRMLTAGVEFLKATLQRMKELEPDEQRHA